MEGELTVTKPVAGVGVYEAGLRFGPAAEAAECAAELEELGYTAAWVPDVGGPLLDRLGCLLKATSTLTVASGVLNLWLQPAVEVAAWYAGMDDQFKNRLMLGIGASHAQIVNPQQPGLYRQPLAAMNSYLDELDNAQRPLPPRKRLLAALGPKMLATARDRSIGAHPYLATPEHTAAARSILGPESLLAPEQGVVLEADARKAREIARKNLDAYFGFPNYLNNWRRLGFTEDDIRRPGSDRLIDALVAWGDAQAIADRVRAHRDAGADHVCVQIMIDRDSTETMPRQHWRDLAPALVEAVPQAR
jgi:probable F420-dependent oxidoreductase